MEVPSAQELEELKYSELQKVAKIAGLKANLKANKLLKALKQHFQHEPKLENDSQEIKKENTPLGSTAGRRKSKRHRTEDILVQPTMVEDIEVMPTENSHAEDNTSGNILQHVTHLSKSGQAVMKAVTTPDFKKLHEAHFKKMESIDKYLERKRKRFDAIGSSIREVKMLVEKSSLLKPSEKRTPGRDLKKPLNTRISLFSPMPSKSRHSFICTPASQRRSPRISINVANRSILTEKSVFKPSVLSSSKMNVRFSEATKDNEHKRSLTKTPARKSPYNNANTPNSQQMKGKPVPLKKSAIKPANSEAAVEKNKPEALTPFKFAAENIETPATNNKLSFDLKASLARPLGYQPYKGKLKPWGILQENLIAMDKSASLKKDYKQYSIQTREERRKKLFEGRKQHKDEMLGSRRGLARP